MEIIQLECVMCMTKFASYKKRECCSPSCAGHLARITAMRYQNRYTPYCISCDCEGAFCLNRMGHYLHWRYTGPPNIQEPVFPQKSINLNINVQKDEQPTQNEFKKMLDEKAQMINKKDIDGALREVKKIIPNESVGLVGLGLAVGVIIKAYFLWTFAAGAAAAYLFKAYNDRQTK